MQSHRTAFLALAAVVAIAVIVAGCGLARAQLQRTNDGPVTQAIPTAAPLPTEVPAELREFWEAWQILKQDYVDPNALDPEKISRGAIKGALQALGDPYTAYVSSEHYQIQIDDIEGTFEGIGAVVGLRDNRLVIVSPLRNTPAERAGLRPGDLLLAVDNVSTEGMTAAEAASRVRGKSGTTVVLRIATGPSDPREVPIERETITVPSVTVDHLEDGIVHISLISFGRRTDEDLQKALAGLDLRATKGIVLDLRYNPGGLLDTAVGVASQFFADGVVLYELDRDGKESSHSVVPHGAAPDEPLVVLVNGGSASASEVVAGALQDRGRAVLVGEKTFGKGSVNLLRRLSSGSGLYVTSGRWLTPTHRPIEGVGLEPDVVVADDLETPEDEQLQRAVEELKKRS